jgi:hypothetical protein
VEVAWGKPREIRFRITNINPNNHSPISMELLGNGSGVMVVVASTSSRDSYAAGKLVPAMPS